MKKREIWMIVAVLLLAAVLFALRFFFGAGSDEPTVTVYLEDEIYCRAPASAYQTITIDQGNGRVNVVRIDETGVYMDSSTCKNQICVHTGHLDPKHAGELELNHWIICLPNRVSVELSRGNQDGE